MDARLKDQEEKLAQAVAKHALAKSEVANLASKVAQPANGGAPASAQQQPRAPVFEKHDHDLVRDLLKLVDGDTVARLAEQNGLDPAAVNAQTTAVVEKLRRASAHVAPEAPGAESVPPQKADTAPATEAGVDVQTLK